MFKVENDRQQRFEAAAEFATTFLTEEEKLVLNRYREAALEVTEKEGLPSTPEEIDERMQQCFDRVPGSKRVAEKWARMWDLLISNSNDS